MIRILRVFGGIVVFKHKLYIGINFQAQIVYRDQKVRVGVCESYEILRISAVDSVHSSDRLTICAGYRHGMRHVQAVHPCPCVARNAIRQIAR